MLAVTELVDRLGVIERLEAAIGPIKARRLRFSAGQLLVGVAAAQLAGEEFLVGLDRRRTDTVGQLLAPVAGLSATTATRSPEATLRPLACHPPNWPAPKIHYRPLKITRTLSADSGLSTVRLRNMRQRLAMTAADPEQLH